MHDMLSNRLPNHQGFRLTYTRTLASSLAPRKGLPKFLDD